MKILLIKPPQWGFFHEMERYFPAGLAYLAASARYHGHEVGIFDALIYKEDNRVMPESELFEGQIAKIKNHPGFDHVIHWGSSWERIRQYLSDYNPDLVGITIMHTPNYDTAYETARIVRQVCPDVKIVAGGAHSSILWNHILAEPAWDYCILGEGEDSFPELLKCIEEGKEPYDVDGCAFRVDSGKFNSINPYNQQKIYCNPKTKWIIELDRLHRPAVDLLEVSQYGGWATLITSRGCPFSCNFCTVHPSVGKQFRFRTPQHIADEIEWYGKEWGIKKFWVEDDNFIFDLKRVDSICDLILERNLDIEWEIPNGISVVGLEEKLVRKMAKAGLTGGFIGMESTNRERLKKISKGFTSREQVKNVLDWFATEQVSVGASLVIGLPGQTIEEIVDDLVTVIAEEITLSCSNPFYPLPPAKMWDICMDKGYINKEIDFTWYDEYNFPVGTEDFERREIYEFWIVSYLLQLWPEILKLACKKVYSVDEFINIVNENGRAGDIERTEEGFYYYVPLGKSFSEKLFINPEMENSSKLVDHFSGELMALLAYLLTSKPFVKTQVESVLTGADRAKFFIEGDGSLRSRGIDLLGFKLRKLNGAKQ